MYENYKQQVLYLDDKIFTDTERRHIYIIKCKLLCTVNIGMV